MTAHEFRLRGAVSAAAMLVILTGCASVSMVPAGR